MVGEAEFGLTEMCFPLFGQPRSQGLSSYRLGRARRDPGWVWSRAPQNLGDDN